ncbi:MAG: hypothetical protein ABWY93_33955 [Mycobacterium sp.]
MSIDDPKTDATPAEATGVDPRDTDHATGADQAAENAENDPPA